MVKKHKRVKQAMAKKVLVTGAAGLIGRELCIQLSKKFLVIGVDNNFRYPDFRPSCTYIKSDLTEYLSTSVNDFDFIFHMAAINGTKYFYEIPNRLIENNFGSDLEIFKFANKNKNCKLIYASSSEVVAGTDTFPTSEITDVTIKNIHDARWSYRLSKMLSENYLMNSDLNFLIIRFFNVFGKDSGTGHFVRDIMDKISKGDHSLIGAEETRSFCRVEDAVDAVINVHDIVSREVVNIGSDEEIKISDAADMIAAHLGKQIKWQSSTPRSNSVARRKPDLTKLRSVYSNFNPMPFRDAIKDL